MVKKCLYFIVFIMIFSLVLPTQLSANSYIPKKRVVVMVYDDSGSMWEKNDENENKILIDNWKYANFSLQSFVGLLDEGDQLIIVPMSEPNKRYDIDIKTSKRAMYIENTKEIQGQGNTPISTIDTAITILEDEMIADKNAEFWMIVLTDGIFNELDKERISEADYKEQENHTVSILESFRKNIVNEKILFRSVLVTIESYLSIPEKIQMEEFKSIWKNSLGGEFIEGQDGEDILNKMQQVAALITNRDPNSSNGYELPATFENKQLLLQSPFPLRRITLLQQGTTEFTPINIKEVDINGENNIHSIDGPIYLKTLEDPEKLSTDLFSQITHIKHKQPYSVIPAGNYLFSFQNHTNSFKDSLVILAEPAIDFTVVYKKKNADGSFTEDFNQFFIGDEMNVEVTLYKSGSKKDVLDISQLGNIKNLVNVTTTVGENVIALEWDEIQSKFIGSFTLKNSEDHGTKTLVNIKGFYYKEKEMQLPRKQSRQLSLKKLTDNWLGKVDELDKAPPFKVVPLINGKEMTAEELAQLFEENHLSIFTGKNKINAILEREGNVIVVKPLPYRYEKLTTAGDVVMTLSMQGKYPDERAELQFTIRIQDIPFFKKWGPFIFYSFLIILAGIYIVGLIIKTRFKSNSEYIEYTYSYIGSESHKHTSTQRLESNFFSRWLVPYFAEKCHINNVTFKAAKRGVILPKEQQRSDMEVFGECLDETAGDNDIHLYPNDEVKISDAQCRHTYQYMKN
ncbi:hypothetical protein CIB95_07790 [Lottiidibacillus patelloidae]|uniref:VWFA domain-containing protein n=1 Tax=Lottiidibacillus patelloidae TaxID=2670334 RepID=A0A263BUD8_9BACI|nr:VWA domain-containing protein [Lottiidibacillus patelloidae]OZM57354.1 hypothetical protein CIB95_07790 [Lottiidibacillus patelloidae]